MWFVNVSDRHVVVVVVVCCSNFGLVLRFIVAVFGSCVESVVGQ